MKADRHVRHRALCLALCLLVLSTSTGCVYWRLFKVRRQLAAFDAHCTVTQDPGAIIRFAKPVLKPTDVEWLLGRRAERDGDTWTYRLRKRSETEDGDDPLSRIEVVMRMEDGRVREAVFPPQFNHVLDHDTLSRVFVGAEVAEIEKSTQKTGWQLHKDLDIPRLDRVLVMLGTPTRREDTELHEVLIYEYDLVPPAKEGGDPDVSGVLVFDRQQHKIVHAVVRIGTLGITVYRKPAGPYGVNLQHKKS